MPLLKVVDDRADRRKCGAARGSFNCDPESAEFFPNLRQCDCGERSSSQPRIRIIDIRGPSTSAHLFVYLSNTASESALSVISRHLRGFIAGYALTSFETRCFKKSSGFLPRFAQLNTIRY